MLAGLGMLSQEREGGRGLAQFDASLRPQPDCLLSRAFIGVAGAAVGGAMTSHVRDHAVMPGAEIVDQLGSVGDRDEIPVWMGHEINLRPGGGLAQTHHGTSLGRATNVD